jgi:hypothetical protein
MDLNTNSSPTVTGCTFTSNNGYAIWHAHLEAVDGITNNTASGNGVNSILVTSAGLGANLVLDAGSNLTGGVLVETSISIPVGITLTINGGVNLKFTSGYEVTVDGTLVVNGTAGSPVVFTDDADDSAGGDTNTNGVSVGAVNNWRGIVFNPASTACSLTYADVRYGGSGFVSNIELNTASPSLTNCTIRNCGFRAMDLNNNSLPTVTGCTFLDTPHVAVDQVPLAAVPGFTNNTASGNAGNYMRVTSATVGGVLTIGAQSIMNGALLMSTGINVQSAGVLTVNQGVVFKFDGGYDVVVDGSARFKGTAFEPVVFTDDADDSIAGDTNNNGPSGGGVNAWRGIVFNSGAIASSAENVLVRYTGSGFAPGLVSSSPGVTLRSVRCELTGWYGFVLSAVSGNAMNLVAWNCSARGIHLTGGSFNVLHATVYGSSDGIRAEAAWTGNVVNSISYGNTTNFANFGAGAQVQFSNGAFSGMNGNINSDPQFVDAPAGDLELTVTSPCINTADLLTAVSVLKDHGENSRILDATLSGFPGADMGAYEYGVWDMTVSGVPKIGTTVTFTVTGPPGASLYVLGILDGVYGLSPYGILNAGAIPGVSVVLLTPGPIPVGTPLPLPLPNDPGIVGIAGGIQTLTTPVGIPTLGNFTRLYRATARP